MKLFFDDVAHAERRRMFSDAPTALLARSTMCEIVDSINNDLILEELGVFIKLPIIFFNSLASVADLCNSTRKGMATYQAGLHNLNNLSLCADIINIQAKQQHHNVFGTALY
ncbi:hypothetical protein RRG08_012150 [Elysia crispata]|uniref:Uncharacterized protein n=1 Tax=Elysia crispata TaxID=231223 RepID=A0AAE0ZJS6_9GAST|nr:hypothetical protein RRG08_012150 [Elysia crispata]